MSTNKMILGAKDKPTTGKWIALSFQHIFAMFGATILVPILTGMPIAVALFTSGVGTLIYILCTKAKVPIYLGSSFAFLPQMITIMSSQELTKFEKYGQVLTGLLLVGLVYVVVAIIIKFAGKKWIDKVFPPVIIGPMIMLIGFGLAGSAVANAGLGTDVDGNWIGTWQEVVTAFVTLAIVVLIAIRGKGFIKVVPFLIGIAGGYIVGAILGLVDFSTIKNVITTPKEWIKIPEFVFLGFANKEVDFLGSTITIAKLNLASVISIVPIAFVTICEHIGDHAVLSEITGENYLVDPGLDNTLLGDGIATAFAAMVGGPANTTYGENTSVVGMTKIGSVWVTGLAAIIAILLSFTNVFIKILDTIPNAVLGGMCLVLYGFIGFNGMKVLIEKKVDFSKLRNVVIVSVILVIGLGGAVIGKGAFKIFGTGLAAVVGVILNLALPKEKEEN